MPEVDPAGSAAFCTPKMRARVTKEMPPVCERGACVGTKVLCNWNKGGETKEEKGGTPLVCERGAYLYWYVIGAKVLQNWSKGEEK